jgi:Transcription factor Pcc1
MVLHQQAFTSTMADNSLLFRHACEVEVTFPTNLQAQQAYEILQVDQEPTDRVTKSLEIIMNIENQSTTCCCTNNDDTEEVALTHRLKIRFESTELKMLRVAVSSFYDYLAVVLKTFQEFDPTV